MDCNSCIFCILIFDDLCEKRFMLCYAFIQVIILTIVLKLFQLHLIMTITYDQSGGVGGGGRSKILTHRDIFIKYVQNMEFLCAVLNPLTLLIVNSQLSDLGLLIKLSSCRYRLQ